jgi:hypothetical protein
MPQHGVVAYALDLRRDKTHAQETSSRTGVIVSTLERSSRRERLDIENDIVHEHYTNKNLIDVNHVPNLLGSLKLL